MPSIVLRALSTQLTLTAALGSVGADVVSVRSAVESPAQDHHSQWPGQNLNEDPFGSRAHAPALHVAAFVLAVFGFGLIDVSAFFTLSHLA